MPTHVPDPGIDETAWPLVTVRWEGTPSDERLTIFLAKLDAWLDREERFGLLIDSRGASGFSPEQRSRVVAHMKQNAERTSVLMVQAVVLDNLVQRTLFYGVNLIFRNPFPSKVFADAESARQWLSTMLGQAAGGR